MPHAAGLSGEEPHMEDGFGRRALFREVNARIRFINATFGVRAGSYELLCECGAPDCSCRVEVPSEIYDEAADGELYLVSSGHEHADERVIAADGSYCIVAPAA